MKSLLVCVGNLVLVVLICLSAQSYSISKASSTVFPKGCQNPLAENESYVEFYKNTLDAVVADRGSKGSAILNLYSTVAIRDKWIEKYPSEKTLAFDLLIKDQLCKFQEIASQKGFEGVVNGEFEITNKKLHQHLLLIAPKLYSDFKSIVKQRIAEKNNQNQAVKKLKAHARQIRELKSKAKKRVKSVL